MGRVESITNAGTLGSPTVEFAQQYDKLSRRTGLSATIDNVADFVNAYQYDGLSRLTQVTQTGQSGGNAVADKRVDFAYNLGGQFTVITRYADVLANELVAASHFGYEAGTQRLIGLKHSTTSAATFTAATGNLANYTWTYDVLGRVGTFYSEKDADTATYTYDRTSQLTDVGHTNGTIDVEDYGYDLTGNRTDGDYETPAGNNNRLTTDGTYNYSYDDEGNLTARTELVDGQPTGPTTDYAWDHRNRLTSVTFRPSPGGMMSKRVVYTYDVFDRRIGKQVDDNGDTTFDRSERFVYDGPEVALVFTDPDGDAGTAESSLTNRYLHGPLVDQILADEQIDGPLNEVGDVYWPLVDNLGTVRDIVQHAGGATQSVEHLRYDSFGEIEFDNNAGFAHRFSYTGREFDADTGLYYYRARWYDPVTHRFISEDPIGFAGGDPNLNRYVNNESTNGTDPFGLESWSFDTVTGPVRGAIKDLTRVMHKPIMRPIPRDWPTTSLPINPAYAQKRFEAGDPNYTTTIAEFVDDYQMLVLEAALTYAGLRMPLPSSRFATLPRSTSCPVVAAPKPPFSRVPPPVTNDPITARMRIANTAQRIQNTKPIVGHGNRLFSAAERAEFNVFADRARTAGMCENPFRTGSWGRVVNGKFQERVRIDIGDPSKGGHQRYSHLKIPGVGNHLPVNTPIPGE